MATIKNPVQAAGEGIDPTAVSVEASAALALTALAPTIQPPTDSASVLATDAHAGVGGAFIFNPATGTRAKAIEALPDQQTSEEQ